MSEFSLILFILSLISRGGFRLVRALGGTKCGGPLTKISHSVPNMSFESFRALIVLQIGEHRALKLQNQIRKYQVPKILLKIDI